MKVRDQVTKDKQPRKIEITGKKLPEKESSIIKIREEDRESHAKAYYFSVFLFLFVCLF